MRQILLLVTGVLALAASSSMLKALYPETPSDPATFDPSTGPTAVETIAQLSSGISGAIPIIIAITIVLVVLGGVLGFDWSDSTSADPAPAPIDPANLKPEYPERQATRNAVVRDGFGGAGHDQHQRDNYDATETLITTAAIAGLTLLAAEEQYGEVSVVHEPTQGITEFSGPAAVDYSDPGFGSSDFQ